MSTAARASSAQHRRRDKQSLDYIARSFVAGGVAGCLAKTALAPLDRVKILFQTSNPLYLKYTAHILAGSIAGAVRAISKILETQGALGLFQGHAATLLRMYPYAAVKFMSYEQIKHVIMPHKENETSFRRFMAGALAGCTCVSATYPLEVIRVRLAVDVRTDPSAPRARLRDIARSILHEQPTALSNLFASSASPSESEIPAALRPFAAISNFYRGIVPTLIGIIPYAGVSFLTYETLKAWIMSVPQLERWAIKNIDEVNENRKLLDHMHHIHLSTSHHSSAEASSHHNHVHNHIKLVKPILNAWPNLIIGGLSGIAAQTASYPFEIVRRHMQVAGQSSSTSKTSQSLPPSRTTWQTARNIWIQRGFRGFWVGITIGYIKVIPMFAISFYSYEWLKLVFDIE